jgi:hypothetical protein
MKSKAVSILLTIATILFFTTSSVAAPVASPLGTTFTYQGRLDRDGMPYTGTCNFEFSLWDAETDGILIGGVENITGQSITNGLFTVDLDFGLGAFNGDPRWLDVRVLCPGDMDYSIFPRQELTPTPYALYASSAPWNGLTDRPAGLDDGDDDTTYSAGDGLLISTTTFSIDSTYTQRRVTGNCAVGSTIRAINVDGTVSCGLDAPLNRIQPPKFNTNLFLSGIWVPDYMTTVAIGVDGNPLFSFFDSISEDLMVVHCVDPDCLSYFAYRLDTGGTVGGYSAITIGSDGKGLISYINDSTGDLKVAHCADTSCSSADYITTIDSDGYVGQRTSIVIGTDGYGLISYYDHTNGTLKVAHCNNTLCLNSSLSTLDTVGDATHDTFNGATSITIGWDGLGVISYYDVINSELKVAHCDNLECSTALPTTLDTGGGQYSSIAIGSDGLPLISYYYSSTMDLQVAHCLTESCSTSTTNVLDEDGSTGWYTSLAIGSDGLGIIAYAQDGNHLGVMHCRNVECDSATKISPDLTGINGYYPAITIAPDGMPMIAHISTDTATIRLLHCASIACIPYYKAR